MLTTTSFRYWFTLTSCLIVFSALGQIERCGVQWRRMAQPSFEATKKAVDQEVARWLEEAESTIEPRSAIIIPVVVHIVWHQEEENISDDQILSQLNILNDDFNARNTQLSFLPQEFRGVLADVGIEFCLTDVDDRGRATTGITRTYTLERSIASNQAIIKDATFGGVDAWDTKRFLNIWVGRRDDRVLGDATSPGEVEPHLDGIVIDFRAFGDIGTVIGNEPYHLGRTLTHELGHYLGLDHIWGENADNNLCIFDDGIADTPVQESTYFGECPSTPQRTCGTSDMYMNFLNYTEDACMSMFSLQQKARMLAVLNTVRSGVMEQGRMCGATNTTIFTPDLKFDIYPNPADASLLIELHQAVDQLQLYNALGQRVWEQQNASSTSLMIDVTTLPTGIYYLHFSLLDQHATRKVVIRRAQ